MILDLVDIIAISSGIISLIAVPANIIQYLKKRTEVKSLRQLVQSNYNNFYLIARCLTRLRNSKIKDMNKLLSCYIEEMSIIRGIADSSRENLIAFGREHLKYKPFFEHPAYPGIEQSDEVKLGKPPEQTSNFIQKSSNNK
jgi:hypothetical protein